MLSWSPSRLEIIYQTPPNTNNLNSSSLEESSTKSEKQKPKKREPNKSKKEEEEERNIQYSVRGWTDFTTTNIHPKSIHIVKEYSVDDHYLDEKMDFFNIGQEVFTKLNAVCIYIFFILSIVSSFVFISNLSLIFSF
jgi:hypothetical protein